MTEQGNFIVEFLDINLIVVEADYRIFRSRRGKMLINKDGYKAYE